MFWRGFFKEIFSCSQNFGFLNIFLAEHESYICEKKIAETKLRIFLDCISKNL